MSPFLLFPLAILTPFALTAILLLPSYAGILGASYIIYMPESGVHPLATKLLDVFYIIDVYTQLLTYWQQNMASVDHLRYTLPILGLPLVGVATALYSAYRFIRFMMNIFHLSARI